MGYCSAAESQLCWAEGLSRRDDLFNMQTAKRRKGSEIGLTPSSAPQQTGGLHTIPTTKAERGEWAGKVMGREKPLEHFSFKPNDHWSSMGKGFPAIPGFCLHLAPNATQSMLCHTCCLSSLSCIVQGPIFHHHNPTKLLIARQRQDCTECPSLHTGFTMR